MSRNVLRVRLRVPIVDVDGDHEALEDVEAGARLRSRRWASMRCAPCRRWPWPPPGAPQRLATFPDHANSVTALLAVAARVLEEAKASGGDTVRNASEATAGETQSSSSFDILQGLVIAVDTKDRYTKRHSEDVARYATFLARRIGLPGRRDRDAERGRPAARRRQDRHPGPHPAQAGHAERAESSSVQQHVALGDMIVRDLPDVTAVRAGIRHHHERWDGQGYLDHLAGEEIPPIARILAVADAFSAMTTTARTARPSTSARRSSAWATRRARSSTKARDRVHRGDRARRRPATPRAGDAGAVAVARRSASRMRHVRRGAHGRCRRVACLADVVAPATQRRAR